MSKLRIPLPLLLNKSLVDSNHFFFACSTVHRRRRALLHFEDVRFQGGSTTAVSSETVISPEVAEHQVFWSIKDRGHPELAQVFALIDPLVFRDGFSPPPPLFSGKTAVTECNLHISHIYSWIESPQSVAWFTVSNNLIRLQERGKPRPMFVRSSLPTSSLGKWDFAHHLAWLYNPMQTKQLDENGCVAMGWDASSTGRLIDNTGSSAAKDGKVDIEELKPPSRTMLALSDCGLVR
ncbi:hypothetical protein FNV43_RR09848 [Rhamnella rubrinervis]|uniref:Uncharacterized protein n=1 Tax=Rhamnella rubrinervis TaxID=2594499 RepID=A0A8K0MKK7_9ROSA|nr:hypothetical protein FNV43_RR09848 [Rhamnella rubrinervis]